jgi:hypothetical protein
MGFLITKTSSQCQSTPGYQRWEAHQDCWVVLQAVLPSPPVYVYADIGRGGAKCMDTDDIPKKKKKEPKIYKYRKATHGKKYHKPKVRSLNFTGSTLILNNSKLPLDHTALSGYGSGIL